MGWDQTLPMAPKYFPFPRPSLATFPTIVLCLSHTELDSLTYNRES